MERRIVPMRPMPAQHPPARGECGRERLLAQHRLADPDGGGDLLGVRRVVRGDLQRHPLAFASPSGSSTLAGYAGEALLNHCHRRTAGTGLVSHSKPLAFRAARA